MEYLFLQSAATTGRNGGRTTGYLVSVFESLALAGGTKTEKTNQSQLFPSCSTLFYSFVLLTRIKETANRDPGIVAPTQTTTNIHRTTQLDCCQVESIVNHVH